jgi:hypothetical protein
MGGMVFKMQGTLKENKFTGMWEQVSGDMKGAWTAERSAAAAPAAAAPAGGITGSWALVANTAQGDLQFTMDAKQDGEKVTGSLSSPRGSVDMQSGSMKDGRLQFDIDLGGNVYRVEATVAGDKVDGKWGPVGGGEGGTLSGTRKGAAAPASGASAPAPAIDGTWDCVAITPAGDMPFELNVKSEGERVTGTAGSAEGSIQIGNGNFTSGKLSFEVEYMGGTYRIEAVVEGTLLKGKWSEVGGSENGAFNGKRKS